VQIIPLFGSSALGCTRITNISWEDHRQMANMQKVFISYTDSDEHKALIVRDTIVGAGIETWIAPHGLQAGDRLASLFTELEKADCVIVLLSERAISSRWVQKEIETALALYLEHGRPLVIPALLEPIALPTALASVRAVLLHGNNFDAGVRELVEMCLGEISPKKSFLSRAVDFFQSFDVVEPSTAEEVDLTWSLMEPEYHHRDNTQLTTWSNGRRNILHTLERNGCGPELINRVLGQCDQGLMPRILSRQQKQDVLTWLRNADELSLLLAADLWRMRISGGCRGITLNWVFSFVRRTNNEVRNKEYWQAAGQYEWRGRALIDKAFALGLLVRTTENPRGYYEKMDSQSNPSYNFGPNVFFMGKLASALLAAYPYNPNVSNSDADTERDRAINDGEDGKGVPLW
jgi:hypothetical protein